MEFPALGEFANAYTHTYHISPCNICSSLHDSFPERGEIKFHTIYAMLLEASVPTAGALRIFGSIINCVTLLPDIRNSDFYTVNKGRGFMLRRFNSHEKGFYCVVIHIHVHVNIVCT